MRVFSYFRFQKEASTRILQDEQSSQPEVTSPFVIKRFMCVRPS